MTCENQAVWDLGERERMALILAGVSGPHGLLCFAQNNNKKGFP